MAVCLCGCGENVKAGKTFVHGHHSRYAHPMAGRAQTEESRRKMSETKMAKGCSEETRAKLSVAIKTRLQNPEYMARVSESRKKKWEDPEYRKHQSEVHKGLVGEKSPRFGKKHSEETRKKLSDSHQGPRPWRLGFTHSEETCQKMSASHKGVPLSDQHRKSLGPANKKKWADKSEEERNAWRSKMIKGIHCSPNKPESAVLSILDSLYPGEWKFVGDGQVILGGKNPDFINVNGQKKIIELFGDYFHKGQNPQDRINIFAPFGYETLIIWEHELKEIDNVINRISVFMEAA